VHSAEDLEDYIRFAKSYEEAQSSVDKDATISPTITVSTSSSLGFGGDAASSATFYTPDPHAVSRAEAQSYYAGLNSKPTLLYRTGKEQWSPPRGPEAQRRLKELCEVFAHPIAKSSPIRLRSLRPSDCEGLEPRLGLEGCQAYGRSHGPILSIISRVC
jgi:hypothetical protein